MTSPRPLPPVEFLRECFDYDPKTGLFKWRRRPVEHFANLRVADAWNSRQAGAPAFTWADSWGYLRADVVYEGNRTRLRAHRVAWKMMTGEECGAHTDHKNRQITDNRFENLRDSDARRNQANKPRKAGKTLPKGVFKSSKGSTYTTKGYGPGGRRVYLGCFATVEAAKAVYDEHGRSQYGDHFLED